MSRRLRFDAAAERELNEAVDFYDLESPGLGDVFLAEVGHALAQIEAFPEAAEPVRAAVRRCLLHKFPYALLYSLRTDEVRILAVAHGRRRPFYWEDRRRARPDERIKLLAAAPVLTSEIVVPAAHPRRVAATERAQQRRWTSREVYSGCEPGPRSLYEAQGCRSRSRRGRILSPRLDLVPSVVVTGVFVFSGFR